ncbi:hypothetical protein EDD18DRAFT_1102747 [Armillaria luteobubalina]|uniref:Uncharacterized protein n=1 Tax=Armillaria luteobubalina TaxID=153913 RepID=A0AA39UVL0_9AGAR|nr:hypothetical protein EDD18DRAFT_1102747 [Armillaria luteobubalina]
MDKVGSGVERPRSSSWVLSSKNSPFQFTCIYGEKPRSVKNLADKERGSWRRITAPGSAIRGFRSGLIFGLRVRLTFVFVFVVPICESADSMGRTKAKKQQATVHRRVYRNLMGPAPAGRSGEIQARLQDLRSRKSQS